MPYIPKQYDSAKAFLQGYSNMGNLINPLDAQRVSSYMLYDDFYHNRPETFKVTMRGESDIEIYLPSSKKIIDSTARFLAVEFDYMLAGGDVALVELYMSNMFKREGIERKFVQAKKSELTRGDAVWHITADSSKPMGQRISVHTVHPSCYFPIEDPNNSERITGVHLVDLIKDPREVGPHRDMTKLVARRQTYKKEPNGQISSEVRTFELGGWDDRHLAADELKPVSTVMPKKLLPAQITQIPVYVISNNIPDGSSWGMSQLSGIEYIINALNQSVTYEDLSLVLQGLGVYVTTAAPPEGADGKPGKYKLHPGNVVELGVGDTFTRVTGVASVAPFQEHMNFMDKYMTDGLGLPDMAQGSIDVAVAQSGIALALKMGPIIAENQDKQLSIKERWDQIGYDLIQGWLPAFEGFESPGTVWDTVFGDPMPVNRDAVVQEIIQLSTAGLLLIDEARIKMQDLGYEYDPSIAQDLLDEQAAKATAATGDPYASGGGFDSGGGLPQLPLESQGALNGNTPV
jgi:hypothetical protein